MTNLSYLIHSWPRKVLDSNLLFFEWKNFVHCTERCTEVGSRAAEVEWKEEWVNFITRMNMTRVNGTKMKMTRQNETHWNRSREILWLKTATAAAADVTQYKLVFFMMRRNSDSSISPSPLRSASSIISCWNNINNAAKYVFESGNCVAPATLRPSNSRPTPSPRASDS